MSILEKTYHLVRVEPDDHHTIFLFMMIWRN